MPYYVIVQKNELPGALRFVRQQILTSSQAIELYELACVYPALNLFKQKNKKEFNIVITDNNTLDDELTKTIDELKNKAETKRIMGFAIPILAGLSAYSYWLADFYRNKDVN